MTALFTQNAKLAASSSAAVLAVNFGIPAYQSASGLRTCPMAGACAAGCYARQGAYAWTPVRAAYEFRLAATLRPDFVAVASAELSAWVRRAERSGRWLVVRIHDSGDFYSAPYAEQWMQVCAAFPAVTFYAYTKQVPMFQALTRQGRIPTNLRLIYSEGGLADSRIDAATERHSRVFGSLDELRAAGYADASADDMVAALGTSHRIGLVYHGAKGRTWSTSTVQGPPAEGTPAGRAA